MTEENIEFIKALETLNKTLGSSANHSKSNSKLLQQSNIQSSALQKKIDKLTSTIEKAISKSSNKSTNSNNASTKTQDNATPAQMSLSKLSINADHLSRSFGKLDQSVNSLATTLSKIASTDLKSKTKLAEQSPEQFGALEGTLLKLDSTVDSLSRTILKTSSIASRQFSSNMSQHKNSLLGNQNLLPKSNSKESEREKRDSINEMIKRKFSEYTSLSPMGRGKGGNIGDYSPIAGKLAQDSILGITKLFGKLGGVVGLLLKPLTLLAGLFGALVSATIDHVQTLLDSLDKLSKFGGHIGLTSQELTKLAHASGYTVGNMDKWADHLAKNSSTLLQMGMPMSDAIRRFSEIANVGSDVKSQLARLGYAFEDQAEAYLDFIDATILRGGTIERDEKKRKKQMTEYFVTQTAINSMLGITKEEMKAERDKLALDDEFQAYMVRLEESGQKDKQESITKMMEMLSAANPKLATAMKEQLTRGTIQTDESAAFVRAGVDLAKFADILRSGDLVKGLKEMGVIAKQTRKSASMFGQDRNGASPGASLENLNAFAFDAKLEEFLRKMAGKTPEEIVEAVRLKLTNTNDANKELQINLQSATLMLKQSVDLLTATLADKTVPVLMSLGKVAANMLKSVFFKGPDLTKDFMTPEEKRAAETKELKDELAELNRQIGTYQTGPSKAVQKFLGTNFKPQAQIDAEARIEEIEKKLGTSKNDLTNENARLTTKAAANQSDAGAGSVGSRIAGAESQGNYNVMYGDRVGKDGKIFNTENNKTAEQATGKQLTELTLNEVQQLQKERPKNKGAVGKYQFMPGTLSDMIKSISASGNEKFDETMQERLYKEFERQQRAALTKAGVPINDENMYLAHFLGAGGAINFYRAMNNDSNSLASSHDFLKNPITANASIFGKSGERSLKDVYSILSNKVNKQQAAKPVTPQDKQQASSGYPVLMNGTEAVVPLSGTPATKQTLPDVAKLMKKPETTSYNAPTDNNSSMNQSDIKAVVAKLDDLLLEMVNSTRVQEKILTTQTA